MKLTIVAGARPNFMKIAPLIREINNHAADDIEYSIVHTGQHYDAKLSKIFFEELEIPAPDINLAVGSGSQSEQTARIMIEFEKYILSNPTDVVIVVGDVNSTMACSIVAKKMQIRIAHIEAGIRSFDYSMPEEVNRVVTDALADYFFTTSDFANQNLKKSGVDSTKIHFVGNVMIDTLVWGLNRLRKPNSIEQSAIEPHQYFVLTLHRPSNVDDQKKLISILETIDQNVDKYKVIFPVHPRTKKMLSKVTWSNLILCEPMGYLEFIYLVSNSKGVITDSGGVQEETTYLNIPCITLRKNTERPETVTEGTNELVGDDTTKLIDCLNRILNGDWKRGRTPLYWDGKTAKRIVDVLRQFQS